MQSGDLSEEDAALEGLGAAMHDPQLDFESAYTAAEAAGVDEQTLLEARIIRNLRTGNIEGLVRSAPQFPPLRDSLEYGSGRLFDSAVDFEAFVDGVYARKAYEEGDIRSFGAYARSSYWKGPKWGQILGVTPLVQDERIKEEDARKLKDVRLSLDRPLETADGGTVTLGELLDGQKALLLDLWGSWCEPCIRNFPRLQHRADTMREHGVVVVGLNVDEEDQHEHAMRFQTLHSMQMPWVLDPLENSLSLQLRIGTLPRVALIGKEGEVLFTGLPSDPQLLMKLEQFKTNDKDSDDDEE